MAMEFIDLFNQGALDGIETPEQLVAFMTTGNGRALAEFGQHMAIDLALKAKNSSWWGNAYHLIVQDLIDLKEKYIKIYLIGKMNKTIYL